jgi:hypothetical protein
VRLSYFQNGGEAHLRLYWRHSGQPRQLVPASAFTHTPEDERSMREIAAGKRELERRADRSGIYGHTPPERPQGPVELSPGPHLLLDDYLIDSSTGVTRTVQRPQRDASIPNPIITGKEDANFQPYLSVLRDAERGVYRIWYGAATEDQRSNASHLGHMESVDGIRWKRPHRILKDPGPIDFGASVLDEGKDYPNPATRYKYAWYNGGLRVAGSPDGLQFTQLFGDRAVLSHSHDINGMFWDPIRKRYAAIVSTIETGSKWSGRRRVTMQSVSRDLRTWQTPWYVLTPDDSIEPGETQFYAMDGVLARGNLLIAMVKVLRDELVADNPPDPHDQYGVGYTALAWSRDGVHWVRDREHFFDPDPKRGAWDHAHAWIDEQLPVGDQVYLYYGGYARGHKVNRFEERQIGLVRMQRDRYVARAAGERAGTLRTAVVVPRGRTLTLNVAAPGGEVRARLLRPDGTPLRGFDFADCRPITGDALDAPVQWKGRLAEVRGTPVRLEFRLRRAKLYAFSLR